MSASGGDLENTRAVAETLPDRDVVQQPVGQLPWGHNLLGAQSP